MRWFKIIAVGLVLAGCGSSETTNSTAPSAANPSSGSAQTTAPATGTQTSEPMMTPTTESAAPTGETAGTPAAEGRVEQQAIQALATHLKLPAADVSVTDVEKMEWPSSGLGCESPDQMYMTMITPGLRLTMMAGGKSYDVHTNEDGSQLVLCEENKPTTLSVQGGGSGGQSSQLPPTLAPTSTSPPPAPPPTSTSAPPPTRTAASKPTTPPATSRPARPIATNTQPPAPTLAPKPTATEEPAVNTPTLADLVLNKHAQDFGVARSALTVTSTEERQWPSSGLGCEKPGEMYLTVITPGFLVVVDQAGTRYNYHTNLDGSRIVLCQQ